MFNVDFQNGLKVLTSEKLLNEREILYQSLRDKFSNHFALFSSGTSSKDLKGYIISKEAIESNARAVNEWFKLTEKDVWGLSLPTYHIGGLSVLVRARLTNSKVISLQKWNPEEWYKNLSNSGVTITTIVPTQLYDIVKINLRSPEALRFIIVGGDFLAEELEKRALDLGWPVIRTYGMSEVSSQLASGKFPGDSLHLLPIHQVKTLEDQTLLVKSPALFTARFILRDKIEITPIDEILDKDGFYQTQDRAEINGGVIKPLGRLNDEIKIAGHLTDIHALKNILQGLLIENDLYGKAEILLQDDERKSKRIILLHLGLNQDFICEIKKRFDPVVIDEIQKVDEFLRTDLGKLKFPLSR